MHPVFAGLWLGSHRVRIVAYGRSGSLPFSLPTISRPDVPVTVVHRLLLTYCARGRRFVRADPGGSCTGPRPLAPADVPVHDGDHPPASSDSRDVAVPISVIRLIRCCAVSPARRPGTDHALIGSTDPGSLPGVADPSDFDATWGSVLGRRGVTFASVRPPYCSGGRLGLGPQKAVTFFSGNCGGAPSAPQARCHRLCRCACPRMRPGSGLRRGDARGPPPHLAGRPRSVSRRAHGQPPGASRRALIRSPPRSNLFFASRFLRRLTSATDARLRRVAETRDPYAAGPHRLAAGVSTIVDAVPYRPCSTTRDRSGWAADELLLCGCPTYSDIVDRN